MAPKLSVISFLLACSLLFVSACKKNNPDLGPFDYTFNFDEGVQNWESFFSDYPVGEEVAYELEFGISELPPELNQSSKALKISGHNHSDDLFSSIYRKFNNLEADKEYSITIEIELASNTPQNAFGIGGSPDLSLGVGGLNYAPKSEIDNQNHYRPNFESQLQSGLSNDVFQVVGKIGVSEEIPTPYLLIERNNLDLPLVVKSNSNGEIWLLIATDSGFEGKTTLFYKSIAIHIQ